MFGIGGGLLAIPILGLFFDQDQQHAQGTAMVMVVPNVIIGLITYARRGRMDTRIALTLAICAVPFTYIGAHIATRAPSGPLRHSFALFLIVLAVYFFIRAQLARADSGVPRTARAPWPWASLIGSAGGMLSGIFSVGGAVFAVPVLAVMFGLTQAAAQGLGLALVTPGTVVGLIAFVRAGDVDWALAIPLALGGVFFVRWGVGLAYRLPERTLRLLFTLMLGASGVALWLKAA